MMALVLMLALAVPAEAHDNPELRCLTRAEYSAKVLEPKARLVACLEDMDTEQARADGLALDLKRSESARIAAEAREAQIKRRRWRWLAVGGAAGGVVVGTALIGGASLVSRTSR